MITGPWIAAGPAAVPTTAQPHRLCVAPMMERTDRHCRYLLRLIAPRAWLYTEMITARALIHGDRAQLLRFDEIEHPVALQLGGNEPGELADAAQWGEEAGYDEINLNAGCPSGRVQAGCFGAALMLEPGRVAECVAAMRARVRIPVTVKTRLGVDEHDSYEFLHAFAHRVVDAGCRTLIVHARKAWLNGLSPKQNREIPPLDYARVHRLKADYPHVEIVINGGFTDAVSVCAQLPQVDGVMLGRAAYHEPMLMARLDALIASPPLVGAASSRDPHVGGASSRDPYVGAASSRDPRTLRPAAARREQVLRHYLRHLEAEVEAGTPLKAMTRHLMGLFARERGGRAWRRGLSLLPDGAAGLRRLRRLVAEHALHADRACTGRGEVDTMAEPIFQLS
jgi:tRNA-dihydrouridine synthase A